MLRKLDFEYINIRVVRLFRPHSTSLTRASLKHIYSSITTVSGME